ncbi:unnamed protein product (macronuclear) [Paramecium tetraurelia]|uniref:TLDc domain-containing protein n=1 Tax=Paramecium tetraurelia TaxID=5888 RepID=A0BY44_PARTE|nr:uncharacterized protein GSPATT00033314001 [Paramecium tetraurelia]CAK63461.1 unnamed protein product [Paramecium tetraurelia]|eukprot:XP_001430859.1 hypothetical protein (macronuclear) [Paramecium tetraurelia strain d4-2]
MSDQEFGKRICQNHANFEIIAVQEIQSDSQDIKYLCVKCLIQMIGIQNIILYEDFIKAKEKRNTCEMEIKQQTQQRVNYMKELQQSVDKLDQLMKGVIGQLQNNIGEKIAQSQKEIEQGDSQGESKSLDENNSIQEGTSGNIDEQEKSKIISNFFRSIKEQVKQMQGSQEYLQIILSIKKIEQSFQIKSEPFQMEINKTLSLKQNCKIHNQVIIMVDLNLYESEPQNRFACVQCIQEFHNQYVSLSDVIQRFRKYNEEKESINESYHTQRKGKFKNTSQMLSQLKNKYNQEISDIVQSLDKQFKEQEYLDQKDNDLSILDIQELDEKEVMDIVDILCKKDQHAELKEKQKTQDENDSKVYKMLKKNLECLMQYDILTIHNLMNILQGDQLNLLNIEDFIENNESIIKLDDNQFIKKFQRLQQYLSIIEYSFSFYNDLKKEVDERNQSQPQKFEQEFQQFQSNSTKMITLITAEDNEKQLKLLQEETLQQKQRLLDDEKQIEQFTLQIKQMNDELVQLKEKQIELQAKIQEDISQIEIQQKKLKEEENANKILQQTVEAQANTINQQKQRIEKNEADLTDATSKLQKNDEGLKELQCVYQFVNISWKIGTNTILKSDFCTKILTNIEVKMKKKIKNQYLIFSGQNQELNSQAFWKAVEKTSNLLMIFKSKSGNIFGGFSPCQWVKMGGAFVQDNATASFLFSQTHDLIYPLKEENKLYAIYCHQSFGPTFGNGHDLQIGSDFQSGYSNLGYHYNWDGYQYANSTHLFGQLTPNIEVCEIIMLTFL